MANLTNFHETDKQIDLSVRSVVDVQRTDVELARDFPMAARYPRYVSQPRATATHRAWCLFCHSTSRSGIRLRRRATSDILDGCPITPWGLARLVLHSRGPLTLALCCNTGTVRYKISRLFLLGSQQIFDLHPRASSFHSSPRQETLMKRSVHAPTSPLSLSQVSTLDRTHIWR